MSEYRTLSQAVSGVELKEKGSRFIGFAFPIEDEGDFKVGLEEIKAEHHKASHHCFAFRIGPEGHQHRANDDGEPSGTAGLPIYNQLLAFEVTNAAVVVVRYFGGTKLGSSGLVKAYKEAAKLTLQQCSIIAKKILFRVTIVFPYELQHQIFLLIQKSEGFVKEFVSEKNAKIVAEIPLKNKKSTAEKLSAMPNVTFNLEN